jgi:2,3-bisphosphoglycerate-dependent phosphoglycerate mutase
MAKLIIARHHESEWNKLGQWTGIRDRHLTEYGFKKSTEMGDVIRDIHIDAAFASMQVRSIETLSCMLESLKAFHVETEHSAALNERDYGEYTGKNKWDMQTLLGVEAWENVRRGWDVPVPGGETLKMVAARTVPFFLSHILPKVHANKNVLVVSHGNAIRTIMKYIENISDDAVCDVEIGFGQILIYELDHEGHMLSKEVRRVESHVEA